MGKIVFYLKEPTETKSLIILQHKHKGQRLKYYTGRSVPTKSWNTKTQRVKENGETRKSKDAEINEVLDELAKIVRDAYKIGPTPTPEMVKGKLDEWMGKHLKEAEAKKRAIRESVNSFWELISRFETGAIRGKGKSVKRDSTLKTYSTVRGHLEAFEKTGYKLSFESINERFLEKYIPFLEERLSANTIQKNLKILKLFLGKGEKEGNRVPPFYKSDEFSYSGEDADRITLTEAELKRLYEHDLSDIPFLERARDLFVFGCEIGQRYSDLTNITPDKFRTEDGIQYLDLVQQKTDAKVSIPLVSARAKEIMRKYSRNKNSLPEFIALQNFNNYIKEAAEKAGLKALGRSKKDPAKPLHDLLSSHAMRRTYATISVMKGLVSRDMIRRITGHKSQSEFDKYVNIESKENARAVAKAVLANESKKEGRKPRAKKPQHIIKKRPNRSKPATNG
jgi:integrase